MTDRPSQPVGGHYFSEAPDAPSRRRVVELTLPEGRQLSFETDAGVFSPERVDAGTRTLLADVPEPDGKTLVDLGAGWGPIAITMALRSHPEATVWAVEINERARDLCRTNAARSGVADRVRVVAPEEFPGDLQVDVIWSNPPIRIGKALLHDLLDDWLGRLRPDGSAELVVHRHLGADSLARRLSERGHRVTRRASRGGYRLLAVAPISGDGDRPDALVR